MRCCATWRPRCCATRPSAPRVPKAKELRRVVEPLITLAKIDSDGQAAPGVLAAARRARWSRSCSPTWVRASRRAPGGYTRILQDGAAPGRLGRHGADAAGRGSRQAEKAAERRRQGKARQEGQESRSRGRGSGSARPSAARRRRPDERRGRPGLPAEGRRRVGQAAAASRRRTRPGSCSPAPPSVVDDVVLDADAAVRPQLAPPRPNR